MSLVFTPPPVTNGGINGQELWKLLTGAAGDIELNQPAGAQGINAVNPGESTQGLYMGNNFSTFKASAFTYTSGNARHVAGVINLPGSPAVLLSVNLATGAIKKIAISDGAQGDLSATAGTQSTTLRWDETAQDSSIFDSGSSDRLRVYRRISKHEIEILVAGARQILNRTEATQWVIADGSNNKVFAVQNTGEIQTNQAEAATGIDDTIINRIPWYDEAGAFLGYVPVMNDP